MLVVSVLPVLIVSAISIKHVVEQAESLTLEKAQGYVKGGSLELSEFFSSRKSEIRTYANAKLLQTLDFNLIGPYLLGELDKNSFAYEKFIFGLPNGHFYNTAGGNVWQAGLRTFNDKDPEAKPKSISSRDYWKYALGENEANERRVYDSSPMISFTTGAKQVVISATVLSEEGKAVAMLGGAVDWPTMKGQVDAVRDNIQRYLGGEAKFFLTSSDGVYWHHWDLEKVVRVKFDDKGNSVKSSIGESVIVKSKITEEEVPELREAGKKMIAGESGVAKYFDPISGDEQYLIYAPIKSANYSVGVVIPRMTIMAPTLRLKLTLFFITLSAVVAIFLFAFILVGAVVKPIVRLRQSTAKISSGEWLQGIIPKGNDEITELTRDFNVMVDSLQKREMEVRELNVELESRVEARTMELNKQTKELEKSNAELENFAYIASHDLQEPARMVSSFTKLLSEKYGDQLDGKGRKYIANAYDSSVRMRRLISDLLEYSKVGTEQQPLEKVDLNQTLSRVLDDLHLFTKECNSHILVQGELPEIWVDEMQMSRLFQNLIQNAVKYRHDSRDPIVQISVLEKEACWEFSFKDNGVGIEEEHFEKAFKIFQRLVGRDKYEGTGIGLALCKRIVERHKGTIWIESKVNEGSVFMFTISKMRQEVVCES